MSWIGKKAADVVTSGQQLANGTVTAIKLAAGAVVSHLGYTPANKAGETFTGGITVPSLTVLGDSYPQLHIQSSIRDWVVFNDTYGGAGGRLVIKDNTLSLDRLTIDTSGRVQIPNQPYAYWAINLTGWTGSQYTRAVTIYKNIGNCLASISHPLSGSYGRFTAPVAGRYLITIAGDGISQTPGYGPNGASAMSLINLYTSFSGAEVIDTRNGHADNAGYAVVLYLNAGDYVNPDWYQGSVGYESGGSLLFTASLIG